MIDFVAFPKIPRLSREVIVTEKIDGTNASVLIVENESDEHGTAVAPRIYAGSRTRWITPEDDNFGFAKWVRQNAEELVKLGPGHHFGEWWGVGIQRHYDLSERRFSLFNTLRWNEETLPKCCSVVPVLYRGEFDTNKIDMALQRLALDGSLAAPGFMKPEGVVVFHTAGNLLFKKTCEHDDEPKNAHPKKDRVPQEKKPKNPNIGGRRVGQFNFVGLEKRFSNYE